MTFFNKETSMFFDSLCFVRTKVKGMVLSKFALTILFCLVACSNALGDRLEITKLYAPSEGYIYLEKKGTTGTKYPAGGNFEYENNTEGTTEIIVHWYRFNGRLNFSSCNDYTLQNNFGVFFATENNSNFIQQTDHSKECYAKIIINTTTKTIEVNQWGPCDETTYPSINGQTQKGTSTLTAHSLGANIGCDQITKNALRDSLILIANNNKPTLIDYCEKAELKLDSIFYIQNNDSTNIDNEERESYSADTYIAAWSAFNGNNTTIFYQHIPIIIEDKTQPIVDAAPESIDVNLHLTASCNFGKETLLEKINSIYENIDIAETFKISDNCSSNNDINITKTLWNTTNNTEHTNDFIEKGETVALKWDFTDKAGNKISHIRNVSAFIRLVHNDTSITD